MRTALLTATLAALVAANPAPRKPAAHDVFVAVLSGAYEVPAVETQASGTAELRVVGTRLAYQVHVAAIRDVTGAYIHIGQAGETTPAVADLFDGVKSGPTSGVLASGTLAPGALHETTLHRLLQALEQGDAYVTVHTLAHPGGELRGQLRAQPAVASR
jgi:uncharacterized membrane protein YgdD (TMEM256/DUF423 family)